MCHSVKCLEICNILLSPKCPALSIFLTTQVKDIVDKHHSPESSKYVSTNTYRNCSQLLCISNFMSK